MNSVTKPEVFTSATAAVTRWDYREGTNALWKKTDAAEHSVVYAYGADGMRETKTNARNITTTYGYETVGEGENKKTLPGRLTRLTYSDDTPEVVMTYRRSGELGTVSDAAGLSTFTGAVSDRTVTVTGNGLMSGLVVGRTERGPDQPETVLAQVGGSTVVSNQHAWTGAGLLHQAWQGVRDTGFGGNGLRQTWNRTAATGRLESVTSEAFGIDSGATHGVSRNYMHSAGGRIDQVWYNARPVGAADAGASVQGFDYDHDTHGRREVVRPHLPNAAPAAAEQPPGWKYGYNERGEVETADRFTAEAGPETGIVGHQRRSYVYDLMGNRDTATQGTAAAEQRQTGYSANILQQYNGLTHSRSVEITGQAVAGATVELTLDAGTPLTVDRTLPQHQTGDPHSFRFVHTVAGTEARWLHVQIKASAGGINLTRQGFVYVPPASETVAHDDDGNLTEDAQWEYTWDAENRMTSATQKALPVAAGVSTPPPARKKLTFAYDHRNRRIAKRVFQLETLNLEPATWRLVKDLRFVHDGYQMIAELDHTFATGTGLEGSRVNRTFLWGPDVSGTMSGAGGVGGLLSTTYQGVSYQVCSDANGNVTGLVPTSGPGAGTLVARFDYDPFGNRITNTGPDVELCPFGFSSKYLDVETGIVNYELRPYQPPTGRFMCGDPIEEQGGINLYGFVGNDAVNEIDLLGLINDNAWPGSQTDSSWPDRIPKPGKSIGEKIFWRWLKGPFGVHLLEINDGLQEMERDLKVDFDDFYYDYGIELREQGKLSPGKWVKVNIPKQHVGKIKPQWFWPSTGFMSAGWWLAHGNNIFVEGTIEYYCHDRGVYFKKRNIIWEWNDQIDAQDYEGLKQRGMNVGRQIFEGVIYKTFENAMELWFNVKVTGSDRRAGEGP